jgi:aminoglycoside phosphotransferase (APT) family kinase protein
MEVLDPEAMTRRLAPHLDGGMRVVAARVVAIASGRRAVVAYDTAGPQGIGRALIGKLYAEPGRAGRMHALLQRMEALGMAAPRPVAHLPELGMAVFTASAGITLDRLEGAERRDGMVAAAAWLAALHGSGLELERSFDFAAERGSLRVWGAMVTAHHPAATAATARLLKRLEELAADLRPSSAAPIHKDFHYQHCLVDEGRLVVIDLDEARSGDPGFDVAHFAANLRLLELREGTSAGGAGELETAFLDAYATRTGRRPGDAHRWFHAYTCLKIARQLLRGRGPAPAPTGAELDRQLQLILAEGLR